jgi:membrane-associated phospholipid phosphatase
MTTGRRRELVRLVEHIQMLTRELQNLPQRELETPEVDAKERTLERLRRQLEAVAQRSATDELRRGSAPLGGSVPGCPCGLTAGVMLWLHRRRPEGFPFIRTALLLASGLAIVGFLVYPTAPPRLASVGIVDTVSGGHVDLNRGLVSSLYNPYAALPSMHVGYALIVAAGLVRHGRRPLVRAIGALYPPFVLLVIVATGNHFFLDAAAGALVAGLAAALAALLTRRPATKRLAAERTHFGDRVGHHSGCLVLGRG